MVKNGANMPDPNCPSCNKPIATGKLLKCAEVFDRATISAVARCPFCGNVIVFQVRNNRIAIGFTHSAGASRFEAVFEVEAKGLKCVRDKDGVHYTYQGKSYAVRSGRAIKKIRSGDMTT